MSRVEPHPHPLQRRDAEQSRHQTGNRSSAPKTPNVGHTPGKAEGEERDVEEALKKG